MAPPTLSQAHAMGPTATSPAGPHGVPHGMGTPQRDAQGRREQERQSRLE